MIHQGVSVIRNDLPNHSLERTGDAAAEARDNGDAGS